MASSSRVRIRRKRDYGAGAMALTEYKVDRVRSRTASCNGLDRWIFNDPPQGSAHYRRDPAPTHALAAGPIPPRDPVIRRTEPPRAVVLGEAGEQGGWSGRRLVRKGIALPDDCTAKTTTLRKPWRIRSVHTSASAIPCRYVARGEAGFSPRTSARCGGTSPTPLKPVQAKGIVRLDIALQCVPQRGALGAPSASRDAELRGRRFGPPIYGQSGDRLMHPRGSARSAFQQGRCLHPCRLDPRRHRFHALPRAR